jgi:transcription antitermination factor NusG
MRYPSDGDLRRSLVFRPMSRSPEPPTSRSKRQAAAVADAATRGKSRPAAAAPTARSRAQREAETLAASPFERGARVSVLKGPFAGKVGVVQEFDGKGGARVMLGLLAVRLDVKNLVSEVASRGRPRLSSSHRKPLPARS